jgi:hypothetical protein
VSWQRERVAASQVSCVSCHPGLRLSNRPGIPSPANRLRQHLTVVSLQPDNKDGSGHADRPTRFQAFDLAFQDVRSPSRSPSWDLV